MTKKILIVDDELMVRDLVKVGLKDEGYEVFEAKDGIEALNMAREIVPDAIILDVMMPGKIGYQVCTALKNDPKTEHIHIIYLTARGGPSSTKAVELSGGDDFLAKPFDPAELRKKIRKGLGE